LDSGVLSMMMIVSIFLGALGLGALLWGLKQGLFDDPKKFLEAAKFDGEEDLNDAVLLEKKRKELKEKKAKNYMPPD
jgi:cbb3-type cytochrome oxidase maturation protein